MKRLASLIALLVLGLAPARTAMASISTDRADDLWGQPDFVSQGCNITATSGSTLCHPARTAMDAHGNLWVTDWWNSRVVMYPFSGAAGRPSHEAVHVLGQYGDITGRGCNRDGGSTFPPAPSAFTLCNPNGLAFDSHGTLYVSDQENNRILVFLHPATELAADSVLGQPDLQAVEANDTPAASSGNYRCAAPAPAGACTLFSPEGLSVDAAGDLLAADTLNNRVLMWDARTLTRVRKHPCSTACATPAAAVWGQFNSFNTNCPNQPALGALMCEPNPDMQKAGSETLRQPEDAVIDAHGHVLIADTGNNRVLEYASLLSRRADLVYGQNGSPLSNFPNLGMDTASAGSLSGPTGVSVDAGDHVWIADEANNRVLEFPAVSRSISATLPTRVLGQRGSYTSNESNRGGEGPRSLDQPLDVSFDATGDTYVSDHGSNDRVVEYLGLE